VLKCEWNGGFKLGFNISKMKRKEKVKKKYGVILALSLILLAALLLSACSQTETTKAPTSASPTSAVPAAPLASKTAAPAEVKTIKISYSCPKDKGYSTGEEWFAQEFPKRTNGRYKVETYPASTLVPITAVLDSVRKNICQIGLSSTSQFPKDFPLSSLTLTPTLGWPAANQNMYPAATEGWMEFSKIPEVAAELNNGFKFLWNDVLPGSNLVMKSKPVHSAADFKGTKIGASPPLDVLVTSNGGATVNVVAPEIYTNMDKGVIEGTFMSMTMVTDWKVQTIADYLYDFDFGDGNMLVLMNNDFYNSMSPEDQKIFDQTRADAWPYTRDFMVNAYSASRKILADAGKKLVEPTADEIVGWKKGVQPVIDKWKADCKAAGISDAVIDKVFNQWQSIRAKMWQKYNLAGSP
jgi:TRAP-type C4-dicarboxylate transport system substrate-binding protein